MEWYVEPPPEELWLILDCSSNTLNELFNILKILRFVKDPELEIKEVLKYINLNGLTKKELKYIYDNIYWTENIVHIRIIIEKLYYGEKLLMFKTKSKSMIPKYMKKPIKNLNK